MKHWMNFIPLDFTAMSATTADPDDEASEGTPAQSKPLPLLVVPSQQAEEDAFLQILVPPPPPESYLSMASSAIRSTAFWGFTKVKEAGKYAWFRCQQEQRKKAYRLISYQSAKWGY